MVQFVKGEYEVEMDVYIDDLEKYQFLETNSLTVQTPSLEKLADEAVLHHINVFDFQITIYPFEFEGLPVDAIRFDDAFIYKLKRPIGINGINIASAKPDFLDRCLIIEVNRISKEKRRKEEDVKNELKELIPDILGWVFDTLVKVLNYKYKNSDKIRLKEYPRMADFAEYGEIIARCIGYKENEFVKAYFENIEIQNEEVIESSIVARVIIEFMED